MRTISIAVFVLFLHIHVEVAFGQGNANVETVGRLKQSQESLSKVWKDLLDYQKALGAFSPEQGNITGMLNSVDSTSACVMSASVVMNVFQFVTGAAEKRSAGPYVRLLIQNCAEKIDGYLDTVNRLLVQSKNQAIVVSGNQLKFEMSKTSDLFKAIRIPD